MRLPLFCVMCNHIHSNNQYLCQDCHDLLIPLGPACHQCALPLPEYGVCGACLTNPPAINHVFTTYRFEGILRKILHNFKYNENLNATKTLTRLMLNAIPKLYTSECLIPVPIHNTRLQQRGFNQAVILAQQLSKVLTIPYDISLCKKITHTNTQVGLSRRSRETNLQHVFQCSSTHYTHVTIIDDLITTGSTANAIAMELKKQGVIYVDLWCCARA